MNQLIHILTALWLQSFLLATPAFAGVIVGNGDDGADLEGASPLNDGPIVLARAKTQELIQKLNLKGVRTLGMLEDEVTKSTLYLAPQDRQASLPQDQGTFHADMRGLVYARTLPTPHASTRFYPTANTLNAEQLVALHLHEALHRALPAEVREDEQKVAEITLSITAPGATRDQVEQTIDRLIPPPRVLASPSEEGPNPDDPGFSQFETPNSVGYSLRYFLKPNQTTNQSPGRMHSIHSHLYPFGGKHSPFGLGIEMSFLDSGPYGEGPVPGPLGLSARLRLWSQRGFDIGLWGAAFLNTLSTTEMKNSPFGRDVISFGISARKSFKYGYVENLIGVSTSGSSAQKLGQVSYTYGYGTTVQAKVRVGAKAGPITLGGFGELHVMDGFTVQGGAFYYGLDRYRIISAGPELMFTMENFQFGVQGRFLVSSTKGANLDYLGNLLGVGSAQGAVSGSVSVLF